MGSDKCHILQEELLGNDNWQLIFGAMGIEGVRRVRDLEPQRKPRTRRYTKVFWGPVGWVYSIFLFFG
jgi:hypothetical protein